MSLPFILNHSFALYGAVAAAHEQSPNDRSLSLHGSLHALLHLKGKKWDIMKTQQTADAKI